MPAWNFVFSVLDTLRGKSIFCVLDALHENSLLCVVEILHEIFVFWKTCKRIIYYVFWRYAWQFWKMCSDALMCFFDALHDTYVLYVVDNLHDT